MVPSFVYRDGETLELTETGPLSVETVCVGGFFAMVSSDQIGLSLDPANGPRLIELGMAITGAANRQLTVRHPARPEVKSVDVTEFYDPSGEDEGRGRSVVVYGEKHMDRSPCGTGTAAKMTLLHHRGRLKLNETFVNTSPLGTTFEGRLVEETRIGRQDAVVAEIRGQAHITGMHEFVLDPLDPFPKGFLL
jgi:proline racemase